MASFFDKLKKGMGVEFSAEEEKAESFPEEKSEEKPIAESAVVVPEEKPIKTVSTAIGQTRPVKQPRAKKSKKLEIKKEEIIEDKKTELEKKIELKKSDWFEPEGQLAIDVYETDEDLIIQSAIAGVKPTDLDITIENDRVSIKGKRMQQIESEGKNYFYQECYWGSFSREIILPVETDPSRAQAQMKEGILSIRIPKIEREKKRKLDVKQ